MNTSRREFLSGAAAFGLGGWRLFAAPPGWKPHSNPNIVFGVLADTHLRISRSGGYDGRNWPDKYLVAALELVGSKQPKAKIVWCSSTPLKDAEKTAKAKELNEAAAKVVAEIGSIETNDLFALLDPLDRDTNWRDVFHHKKETCKMEARQVADAVLRVVR